MAVMMADKVAETVSLNLNEPFVGDSMATKRLVKLIEIGFDTKNVPLLWGPPGVGKTAIIHSIVARRKMMMRVIIGSTMDPTDVAGLPVLRTLENGESVTSYALPEWFVEVRDYALNNPEGAVIFIEEITTATPPVQAALLTFIQDRRIGKTVLPDNVLIIAAGNPPSQAADGNMLAPPTANRLVHYEYEPSKEDWFKGMTVAWNMPVSDREKQMRGYIVGFLTERTDIINACPDDPEDAGQAWPSMRSWDNAARMLGEAGQDMALASLVVKACVGQKAGGDFMEWMKKLSLPRYENVMANPRSIQWASLRGDVLFMTLSTVVQNVTVSNFNDSLEVFNAAKSANKNDIVAGLILAFKRKTVEQYNLEDVDTKPLARTFARLGVHILGEMHKKATQAAA